MIFSMMMSDDNFDYKKAGQFLVAFIHFQTMILN